VTGRTREAILVVGAAAAAVVVMTYPLAFGFTELGRLRLTDGRWSIWVVAWVAHALSSAPWNLFDANIFHPHHQALAFSEANLGAGILALPAYVTTRNPIATHNAAALASFVLSAISMYSLARYLNTARAAAASAAIAFAFCPYVFSHTAHIQLLMTAGLPLTLLTLHRFVERRSAGRAATFGLAIAAQALSCAYYGIFSALLAVFGVVFFGIRRGLWRERAYQVGAVGAAALAVVLVLPFFIPYLQTQRESGFARSLTDARIFSATWQSYLSSAAWAHRWMQPLLERGLEPLFPGFIAIILGVAGAWLGLRGPSTSLRASPSTSLGASRRDVVVFYSALGILALWISIGPAAGLYTALYHTVPIFSFLRAPSRFGIGVALALSVLMAVALDELARRRPAFAYLAAIMPMVVAAELAVAPLRFDRMPPVPGVYRMLAGLPRGPVAEFPFYADRHDIQFHALYMLFSTYHWQPLLNGYSDNIPPEFYRLASVLRSFPSQEAFDALHERQARYVVIHFPRYSAEHARSVRERLIPFQGLLHLVTRVDTIELYEIGK
jgi:hypothetical protein